jgi:hypothetical protein
MPERPAMTLDRSASLLRRWWWLPIGTMLVGVALSIAVGRSSSPVTAETKAVIIPDFGLEFLAAIDDTTSLEIQGTAHALANAIEDESAAARLGLDVSDASVAVSVTDDFHFTYRVTAESEGAALRISEVVRTYLSELHQTELATALESARQAIDASRAIIEAYLADESGASAPGDGAVLVLDRATAVNQLARYELFNEYATRLEGWEDGIRSSTVLRGGSSPVASGLLAGFVFLALGVVGVLVIGRRSERIMMVEDAAPVLVDLPQLGVIGSDVASTMPVAFAVRHRLPGQTTVAVVSFCDGAQEEVAHRIADHLAAIGDERQVVGTARLPLGLERVLELRATALVLVHIGRDDAHLVRRGLQQLTSCGVDVVGYAIVEE